jgi:shikimate kinase
VKRHLVLVGLPGSGKTTVGARVAQLLGTAFTDIDGIVAATAAMPVAEVFATSGEPHFRRLERAAMDGALAAPAHVVAPGAGWAAEPGNLEAAGSALLCYLRVDPAVAAARLEGDTTRPLLAGAAREERIAELLARREPWYFRAGFEVSADAPVAAVADELVRIAGREGGWWPRR